MSLFLTNQAAVTLLFFLYLDPFPRNSIYFLKDILAVVLCFLGLGKEKRKNFGAKITRFYVTVCVIT